jgi:hypothetical protein
MMVPARGKFGVRKAQSPALREALSPNPTTRPQQRRALTWQASHSRYYSDFELEDQVALRFVPDKRGNRKLEVLELDLSGNATYQDLKQASRIVSGLRMLKLVAEVKVIF